MIDGQIATLPIQPNDPWFRFFNSFNALPFKTKDGLKQKSVPANSNLISGGIVISATLSGELLTLRVLFDESFAFLVGKELIEKCRNLGWTHHSKAPDQLLFRKEVRSSGDLVDSASHFISLLNVFGVDPYQDWGM